MKIKNIIKRFLHIPRNWFKKMSGVFSLTDNGERVDINYNQPIDQNRLDKYQKSHLKRYEYALKNINENDVVADLACGTGYGSVMLATKAKTVTGLDFNHRVINKIKKRYKNIKNVAFFEANILDIDYNDTFDLIVSFETLEHFKENDIRKLFLLYNKALKPGGRLIISTPYMQENSVRALEMGFHQTFHIDESKVENWLKNSGFELLSIKYQNYDTHDLKDEEEKKDFVICLAKKK